MRQQPHDCDFCTLAMTKVHGQAALHLGADMLLVLNVFR